MPYALLDDSFYDHPKITACSDAAAGLFAKALTYCMRHLTDGQIDRSALHQISTSSPRTVDKLITELVDIGMLEDVTTQAEREHDARRRQIRRFDIHDFHDFQPSARAVKQKRREVSDARSQAGKKGAKSRWGDGKPDGKPIANGSQPDGNGMAPNPSPNPTSLTGDKSTSPVNSGLPRNNEPVGVCERCGCDTDRPGAYLVDGIDTICDHAPLSEQEFLA